MKYSEERKDLFSVQDEYYLAHCISADFGMGKGIVVEFNKRYNLKNTLQKKYHNFLSHWDLVDDDKKGDCILEGKVFNLITKRNYWLKPTCKTLKNSLNAMKILALNNNVKKIAMPLIGCGLDKLKWEKVSEIIKETFSDTDIEILICIK